MSSGSQELEAGRCAQFADRMLGAGAALRYGVGLALTALAALLRLALDPWAGDYVRLPLLFAAVAGVVWCAGAGPAAVAAVVGYLAFDFLFIPPRGTLALAGGGLQEVVGALAYAVSCAVIIGFASSWRRTRARLQQLRTVRARGQTEEALMRSERRFRVAQDSSLGAFTILRAIRDSSGEIVDFEWLYANLAAGRILRHPPEGLVGRRLLEVLPGNRSESGLFDAYVRVVETRVPHDIEVPYRADGIDGWFHNVASPLEDGVAVWFTDISGRKRVEEHLQLLVGELSHRVKNTLAIVQSLTSQTLRGSESLETFHRTFTGRLAALAAAHDLLVGEGWKSVSLGQLVERTLASQCPPGQLEFSGPNVRVAANAAISLNMAMHELATNALKYGALAGPGGKVVVTWCVHHDDGPPRVVVRWLERGGPPVAPVEREGFGSRLIRQLGRELGADVELRFDPEGVECRIVLPLGPRAALVTAVS